MAIPQTSNNQNLAADSNTVLRIAVCGEVSSGKSTVLNTILRENVLPDFFGVQDPPVIRVRFTSTEAEARAVVTFEDGRTETHDDPSDILHEEGMSELVISCPEHEHLHGIELLECPALRDGEVSEEAIERIAGCDVLVWVTIGSQAWRLSEKTILDDIGKRRPSVALLAVSRGDKFRSDSDRERVMERVERETQGYFSERILLHASPKILDASAEDDSVFAQSGGLGLSKLFEDFLAKAKRGELVSDAEGGEVVEFVSYREEEVPLPEDDLGPMPALIDERDLLPPEDREDTPAEEEALVEEASVEPPEEALVDEVAVEPQEETTVSETLEVQAAPPIVSRPVAAAIEESGETFDPTSPHGKLRQVAETLHGALAIATFPIDTPDDLTIVLGSKDTATAFAKFCAASAKSVKGLEWFGGAEMQPENEQITMTQHQVIYHLTKNGKNMLIFVSEASKFSPGIARTAFLRLSRIHDLI